MLKSCEELVRNFSSLSTDRRNSALWPVCRVTRRARHPGTQPLIGWEWSRDLDTSLWLAESDHVTWILASHWLRVITWPMYWPLIGWVWSPDLPDTHIVNISQSTHSKCKYSKHNQRALCFCLDSLTLERWNYQETCSFSTNIFMLNITFTIQKNKYLIAMWCLL